MKRIFLGTVLLFFAVESFSFGAETQARKLSYPDLVRQLTDLEQLAVLPDPGENCLQWSSYDRSSRYEEDRYLNWDANGDGNGCLRKEGNLWVLGEMEGPGCIRRIWSAAPGQGRVMIYLDGNPVPAVDLPFVEYFDRSQKPFNYSALNYTAARGWNCFVPIPFAKSCKIVAEENWGNYYHFTYTLFPEGTEVPTFSRNLSEEDFQALAQADTLLGNPGRKPSLYPDEKKAGLLDIRLMPGETMTVAELEGPRAITSLRATVQLPEDVEEQREILRNLILKINWDGEAEPSVLTPLGDFFGTAPGVNEYKSLVSGVCEGNWYSYWYMPFEKTAKIEVINLGTAPRVLLVQAEHAALNYPIEKLGRFHAKWHRDCFPYAEDERAAIDWRMLYTEGTGRYCGVMLHVWNPRGAWWGEGDEKFYVDGEKFPSTFGTGSEDYFGYAWCCPDLFQRALHNQTISMGNKGHISVNRWHIADNVPFQNSFDGSIEKYFPNQRPTLYAATVYWYLNPQGKDPYSEVHLKERTGYWVPILPYKVKGALEAESLEIIKCTGGTHEIQDMSGFTDGFWSQDKHLWWKNPQQGDELVLELPVKEKGNYHLKAGFTRANDYGIFQLWLDDKKLGEPIDFYNTRVVSTGAIDFGSHSLKKGNHRLKIEFIGRNEKAVPNNMLGLDFILLEPSDDE